MKKTAIALVTVAALALGLITLVHRRSPERGDLRPDTADPGRQRIRKFWDLYNQANTDRVAGNYAKAVAGFRASLELDPRHEDSLYNLGTSLNELGDYQEAAATFQQLIAVNPASNRGFSELGNTLALFAPGTPQDFQAARVAFERSVQINREQAGPFLQLGKLEFNQGDWNGALEHFLVAAGFQSPEGNFLAGYTHFSRGEYTEAAGFFLKVLKGLQRERAITGRGVLSEGDLLPAPGQSPSLLERAALKSLVFLYWSSVRLGAYPPGTPQEFEFHKPALPPPPFQIRRIAGDWRPHTGNCLEPLRPAGQLPSGTIVQCLANDFDADGNADVFVLRWRKEAILYRKHGSGNFSDATQSAGLSGIRGPSLSAVSFDYNKDGLPDLLVTAHAPYEEAIRSLLQPSYQATRNTPRLFRNKGAGKFEEVSAQVGLTRSYGTMQAIAADFDGDGWVDLLLANGSLDRLRVEPSVVLRNLEGREFREWVYLPDFDTPDNFIGASLEGPNQPGDLVVNFVRNPFFGRR